MRCAAARPSASRPDARRRTPTSSPGATACACRATLHEHTGHGLAELAAHLHTTVEGVLDVHAGMEDTVRLAGHMRDRWDGGAAIVAAMTDDTVGGGGIRVTTPLDLWVHGLMGAEERIGTCTADAVLMELGATHYEREYGPGVHAAGLAAYTGSLYQSNRSTFRALMRVSSGVRNLIAGRGGGGGGGNGGAGRAPAASPPPVPAQTGAASESATGTLAAGRRAAQAPATTFDIADALTGARRAPLEEFVDSIDARVAEEIGEPGTVVRAENLPELSRCADTAEQLGALQETLRIDGAASGSETARGMRASEAEGALSMHPAGGEGGALEIEPPSAVYGENAAMVRPHPGVPWGQGPEMKLGLLGGADRPPQSAAPGSDFPAVYRRMRELRSHYNRHSRSDIVYSFTLVTTNISRKVAHQFRRFGGNTEELAHRARGITTADQAYRTLQETARQAERDGDLTRAGTIHEALGAIDELAVEMLQAVLAKHGIAEPPSIQAMQRPPTAADPTVTVTAIPPPAHTPMQFDWITAFNQVRDFARRSLDIGFDLGHSDARAAADRISKSVMRRFRKFGGNPAHLLPPSGGSSATEQAYRTIEDMVRHAAESGSATRTCAIRQALEFIHQYATIELDKLTREYGALDALSIQATRTMQVTQAMQRLPATAGPLVTVASTTAALVGRLDVPGPAHRIVRRVDPPFPEPAAGLVQTTDVPGLPPASGLPGPPLSEAAGAEAGDLGRVRLDPTRHRLRHHGRASGDRREHRQAFACRVVLVLAATGRPRAGAWHRSLRPRPAPRRHGCATASRHHHRAQHRPCSLSRRCVPHPVVAGRRLPGRARPARCKSWASRPAVARPRAGAAAPARRACAAERGLDHRPGGARRDGA